MILTDSHCHLDLLDYSNNQTMHGYIQAAAQEDIKYILNVCVSVKHFQTVLAPALEYPHISASVGLHPNSQDEETSLQELLELGTHKKVVAIGETGLDYYRSEGDLDWQRQRFRAHIQAAKTLNKPLIVHTRQAKEDTLQIMREENAALAQGVMHCFSEDWETARAALDMGFYISFSGILTFKSANVLQEVARKLPSDRILIETDAPYLAPNPKRGKSNEPAFVRYTALYLAELRNTSLDVIAEQTTNNFLTLFKGIKR